MLAKKLERENIEYDCVSLFDDDKVDKKLYKKYNVKSTPVLVVLDNGLETDRLSSIDEILKFLKQNVSNIKIPL